MRAKQDRWEPLTRSLAVLLSEKLIPFAENWKVDTIIPIPTHWRRRWQRLTNAAEVLAVGIGRNLQLPVFPHGLVCRRLAGKQGMLTPAARRKNVRGVYSVTNQHQFEGKNVLLVDDVMTTGATVNEASRMLLAAGAANVVVTVIARGVGRPNATH
jgi:ComF family protein